MGMTSAEALANKRTLNAGVNETANATAQNSTLGQYEGDLQQTDIYKRMYGQRLQATSAAYNNVRAARSARARMAGFGYTSPQANTDNATMDQLQANEEGRIGSETMQSLMPYQMEAAKLRGSNIKTYSDEGTDSLKIEQEAEKARLARRAGMFSKLAGLGLMGASMIPGVGPAVSAGLQSAGSGMMQ